MINQEYNGYIDPNSCLGYEADSSPQAWKFYTYIYKTVFEEDALNQTREKTTKSGLKRIYATKCMGIDISGDVIFNFKNYPEFNILNKDPDGKKRLALYNKKEFHYSYCNISLFPSTGKLQSVKGFRFHDRIDKFLNELRLFYDNPDNEKHPFYTYSKSISNQNMDLLKNFLISIGGNKGSERFNNYCKKMYLIDEILANKLADNGKEKIDNLEKAIEYMDLAKEFWETRSSNIMKMQLI